MTGKVGKRDAKIKHVRLVDPISESDLFDPGCDQSSSPTIAKRYAHDVRAAFHSLFNGASDNERRLRIPDRTPSLHRSLHLHEVDAWRMTVRHPASHREPG